ncbi:MAG: GlsB/YeaQ/YmgE family stress response membrane protein [Candidatus Saccharibacteria bacterium]
MILEIVMWAVLGALAGWAASIIMKTNARTSMWSNIAIGIIGAFIGGLTVRFLTGDPVDSFNLMSIVVAIVGSVALLAIVKAATGGSRAKRV